MGTSEKQKWAEKQASKQKPTKKWRLNSKSSSAKLLEVVSDLYWIFCTLICHLLNTRVAYAN